MPGGLDLGRILLVQVAQRDDLGVAKERVVVEVELGIERHHASVAGDNQRVDLGERGVGRVEALVQRLEERTALRSRPIRNADARGNLVGVDVVQALRRVDVHLVDLLRRARRDLLDVHAAFRGGHQHDLLRAAVDHHADVELLFDVGAFLDEQPPYFLPCRTGLMGDEPHAKHF